MPYIRNNDDYDRAMREAYEAGLTEPPASAGSPFALEPERMTRKWVQRRSDGELERLAKHYCSATERGQMIREEIRRREGEW